MIRRRSLVSHKLVLLFAILASRGDTTSAADPQSRVPPSLKYPEAKRGDVVDDYNGVKVPDPYRWMEDLNSEETHQWVLAQAKLADDYLARLTVRESLKQRLTKLLDFEKFGMPFHRGERYFYSHNRGLQQQSILYTTVGLNGKPSIAFDPNAISSNGTVAIAGYVPSPDGLKLLYGLSQGGSDWTEWHIRDLPSGKDLPDVLRWTKYYHPVFANDGQGLFYSAFPAPAAGEELKVRDLGNAVYYHALGTSQSADRKVFERADHSDWQFEPFLSRKSKWLVIAAGEGEVGDKGVENIYTIDLTKTGGTVTPLAEGFTAAYVYAGADRGKLYFQSTLEAPRGRVLAIDPEQPGSAAWKEIVPQGADSMDVAGASVTLVDHQLIVRSLHDAHSKVTIYDLAGHLRHEVKLPGAGTASGFGGESDDRETFYSYTDFLIPSTVFRLDLEKGNSQVYRKPKVDFDVNAYESKQVFYSSKDGTRVPIYLVHKQDLKLDGNNPTLLYGYGGFGISILPHFDTARLAWLEHGGVFAVANIRGGGEYGDEWHRQAIHAHKQVVFDDFIAAAEWLIAQKYTSTRKLAIEGGSNGGLLVGACITQRPDLFGAALAYVGVMDMLRFDQFGQGAGWVGDYGSPHDPEDFKALYAYSPVHNVHPGTRYPATMIITGDHDARVMPAHSFKFAAALQAAQTGPAPILLRVRLSTGHGSGATTSQVIAERVDAYAFLMRNLGMD